MTSQPIVCSTLIEQATHSFVSFHQHIGCFHSDWHQHQWGQLMYAEKGCIHLSSQGKQVLVPGWYGVWIPPNTHHATWSTDAQLEMHAVCFPVDADQAQLHQRVSVFPVSALLREMIRYTSRWAQDSINEAQANQFLQVLGAILPDELVKSIPVYLPATVHAKLLAVTTYIQGHLAQSISFSELCREFGMSTRSLSRLFLRELGCSFSSYCKLARIMRALELIELGYDNVGQLALDVGYESLASFSTTFVAIVGQRPLAYIHSRQQP